MTAFVERRVSVAQHGAIVNHADQCSECRCLLSELAWAITESSQLSARATEPHAPAAGARERIPAGATIGRYVVLDLLGAGGMGVVYAAYDPELDRKVALKLLHGEGATEPTRARARIAREAQTMARLSHEHVVSVHDVGTLGDRVFIIMELVDGTSLRHWLLSSRSWRETVDVFVRAGRGLAAAHAARLVHRDFKPDNVMIGRDGRVKVVDFGVATGAGVAGEHLVGTPAYMAPEQLAGGVVSERSDQFSFCVALHEALYGIRPFAAGSSECAQAVETRPLRRIDGAREIPASLRYAVARGLSSDAAERFPSMTALLDELARSLTRAAGRPPRRATPNRGVARSGWPARPGAATRSRATAPRPRVRASAC